MWETYCCCCCWYYYFFDDVLLIFTYRVVLCALGRVTLTIHKHTGRGEPTVGGVGDPCAGCNKPILDKFLLNVLERAWHAHCVRCCECLQPLTDKCFSREAKLYCRNDFFRWVVSRRQQSVSTILEIFSNRQPICNQIPIVHQQQTIQTLRHEMQRLRQWYCTVGSGTETPRQSLPSQLLHLLHMPQTVEHRRAVVRAGRQQVHLQGRFYAGQIAQSSPSCAFVNRWVYVGVIKRMPFI